LNDASLLQHYELVADAPDAVSRLRRLVLALAVRGQLVPQDPTDESASDLLRRIAAKKLRLVKSGIVRNSRGLNDGCPFDEPFNIPKSWRWVQFASIADFSAGRTPPRNDPSFWNTGDYAWVSIADIVDGQILTATKETVSNKARDEVFGSEPELPGTMIMSFKLTIGKIARLRIPAFHNEAIISIKPYLAGLDNYLFKALPQFARQGETKDAIKGATLNRESISKIVLPLPPLAEQRRIVSKIDELMALCDKLDASRVEREAARDRFTAASFARLKVTSNASTFAANARSVFESMQVLTTRRDQIKHLRQIILDLAVHGKLIPQNSDDEPASELLKRIRKWSLEAILRKQIRSPRKALQPISQNEDLPMRPNGWVRVRLGEIIYIQSGDGLTAANMQNGEVPVFGGNGINGYHHRSNVKQETIVIGRVGFHCGSIHVTPSQAWVTDNAFITHFCQEAIFLRFLVLLLKQTNLKEDENATAQPVISGSKIYPIAVGLPPLAEQHRIVARVDELLELCDHLEASLATSEEACRGLLDALIAEALGNS
jgi:type I restriction enzyme, S subunit